MAEQREKQYHKRKTAERRENGIIRKKRGVGEEKTRGKRKF